MTTHFLRGTARAWVTTALIALLLGGCESGYPVTQVPPVPGADKDPSLYEPPLESEYRIGAGDSLLVNSYYEPALKQPVIVQSDGRISLILVGEVMAAGKTPDELRQELMRAYGKYLARTDVTVSVSEIAGETIYVGGEVQRPSMLSARGQITVLQGIAAAGGFTDIANTEQVLILRAAANGRYQVLQQNVDAVLHNQAGELYLRRHDIIYVPRTEIAQIDEFVERYINQIIPRSVSTSFGYQFYNQINGTTTIGR